MLDILIMVVVYLLMTIAGVFGTLAVLFIVGITLCLCLDPEDFR